MSKVTEKPKMTGDIDRNTNHACIDNDDKRQMSQIISIKVMKLGITDYSI